MSSKLVGAAAVLIGGIMLSQPALSAHRARNHHAPAIQQPARIACTVGGCIPIPAACIPVPGRTFSDEPTGYDVIVCPQGVSPYR